MKKAQIFMNILLYLGLSSEISEIVMDEFCYDYVKPKCREKSKLCYMYKDSLILYIEI